MFQKLSSRVSQINIYPVKSTKGISQSNSWVEMQGLSFDRRFMITFPDGTMVTARKYPTLLNVIPTMTQEGMILSYKNKIPLKINYNQFQMAKVNATVWSDTFIAYTTSEDANLWFSDILQCSVKLLFTGKQSKRERKSINQRVSFADGYPLLLISQASLDELNRRSSAQHLMSQFRANLVVSGDEPFIEDNWKRIKIAEVEFEIMKPCQRCILTTVDINTAKFRPSKEPLTTLAKFRANQHGEVFLGQNLVAKNEGMIQVGDQIEILETKPRDIYKDIYVEKLTLTCVYKERIAKDFTTIWFEALSGALPNYLPGQHLPIQLKINGQRLARHYTLSSTPSRPDRYAISVKRINNGQVSNWLHDNLKIGDVIIADTPQGSFHVTSNEHPILLISAGSGVTPMLSMLRYLADKLQIKDVIFFHQCRTSADIPCRSEIEKLNIAHPGLKVLISLTQPDEHWHGLTGRLSLHHFKKMPTLTNRHVFACGPNDFMTQVKRLVTTQGVPEHLYHQEAFSLLTIETPEKKTINVSVNGHVFIGNNQQPLLEQAEAAGFMLENSCRAGLCGACKVILTSGEVHQPDAPALSPADKESGVVLACCCIPITDISVVNKKTIAP